ncbi:unnamed protein product [Sphagnum jensenii]
MRTTTMTSNPERQHPVNSNGCLESLASIAERVFPEEVKEIQRPAPHIDSDRMIGPTDWDRECQESGRLNKR